ncbi:MerR family transcriptional regulator [Anaerovorax sp. IOR16]|uniref:MerR family transcriptional regulator n=1 Tax=Anaerovorax sp. IOR16 TaxID=2773458 RepID=UPI0019D2F036|nr:MerR family transcriptional regulator [Anaerovorax sp. IOR16]
MKEYLTTGEFASLCGVKKDTILYYDEIGILKPDYFAENGYRYYSPNQVMIFEIIASLKAMGMSLKEIQKYRSKQNTKEFLDLLKEKRHELIEMQRHLSYTKKFVDNTIGIIETSLNINIGEIYLEQCDEEYMVITTTPSLDDMNDKSYWVKIEELTEYFNHKKLGNVFPIGEIVLKKNFEQNNFRSDYYSSKPIRKIIGPNIHRKPAGKYAILYHRGSYKTLSAAYTKMKEYIEKNNLKIKGDIYEQDQLYLFSESNPNDYLMKISIPVE